MESKPEAPFSSAEDVNQPQMSLDLDAPLDDLLARQAELLDTRRSLADDLDRLVPQLDEARREAAKPAATPEGASSEALLASATEAFLARYQWQAKQEALEVAIAWTRDQLQTYERQLQQVEGDIERSRQSEARAAAAQQGVDDLNRAIATVKQRLSELKETGCLQLYAVNLPEFSLDERGQIQVRPHSFRVL